MNKHKTLNYSLPIDFDPILYKQLNPDLEHLSNKEAINHYITQGIHEKRLYDIGLPSDFDVNLYKKLNPDIQTLSNKNATSHYKIHGRIENRNYNIQLPFDFDVNIYKKLNIDLQNMSDDDAIIHYKLCGVSENRKYKNNIIIDNRIIDNNRIIDKNNIILFDALENTNYINENNVKNISECNKYTDINIINNLKSITIIIDSNDSNDSNKQFLNSIVSHYKYKNTFLIVNNNNNVLDLFINNDYLINKKYKEDEFILFLNDNITKINKIFINNITNYSIEFINKLINVNVEITVMYDDKIINYYTFILHKSKNIILHDKTNINIDELSNIYTDSQLIVSSFPYYNKIKEIININDAIINIGIIHNDDIFYINILIKYFKLNNKINFFIIKFNNVCELNKLLINNKPQILITTSIITDYNLIKLILLINLPILCFSKSNNNNNLSNYSKAYLYTSNNQLEKLINTYKQNYFYTIEPNIYFNSFWNKYFINNTTKLEDTNYMNSTRNKYDIKPYCVYFPQFHNFIENNIAFYKNFTDIQNLFLLSKNINSNIESPNLQEYNLGNMLDYKLTDHNIIQKQIDIITLYNISGFAIYYYWFSINTITDNHMIMEKVINLFFDNKINMNNRKVFFIWANESWTQNPAFGNSNEKIENIYNEYYINLNVQNLLNYFKHDNYLKIDNKPVFMLHHPWFMTDIEIDLFYNILNYYCIQNSYNGIYFIINSMNGYYDGYLNYNFNFNYKKSTSCYYDEQNSQTYLDYQQYINNDIEHDINNGSSINTLVFDFDNSARLFKPNRIHHSTICINNTELNKIIFINKIIETYIKDKKSDIENILLINGWNEWGEKMNIEPSLEYNFYYLNLLKKYL